MGSKGNSRHIKRLASPRYLHIGKKVDAYISKPNSGRHTLNSSIALGTVLKEKIGLAGNAKEAKRAIKVGSIEINGKVVKDERYPLGYGDVIFIKPASLYYKVAVGSKGAVSVEELGGKPGAQVYKVIGKYMAKDSKEMMRLHDGTILPSAKGVKVNDSVSIKDGKVGSVIKLEQGAKCLVIRGVHASESGVIKGIKPGTALRSATVEIEGDKGNTETLLDNIIVTGGK